MAWVCTPVWGHGPLITYFKTDPQSEGSPHNIRAASESVWSHTYTYTRFRRQAEVCLVLRRDWRTGLEAALQQLGVGRDSNSKGGVRVNCNGGLCTCSKQMVFLKAVSPDFSLCECVSVNRKGEEKNICCMEWISQIDVWVQFSPHNQNKKQNKLCFANLCLF